MIGKSFEQYGRAWLSIWLPLAVLNCWEPTRPTSMNYVMVTRNLIFMKVFGVQASLSFHYGRRSAKLESHCTDSHLNDQITALLMHQMSNYSLLYDFFYTKIRLQFCSTLSILLGSSSSFYNFCIFERWKLVWYLNAGKCLWFQYIGY